MGTHRPITRVTEREKTQFVTFNALVLTSAEIAIAMGVSRGRVYYIRTLVRSEKAEGRQIETTQAIRTEEGRRLEQAASLDEHVDLREKLLAAANALMSVAALMEAEAVMESHVAQPTGSRMGRFFGGRS